METYKAGQKGKRENKGGKANETEAKKDGEDGSDVELVED